MSLRLLKVSPHDSHIYILLLLLLLLLYGNVFSRHNPKGGSAVCSKSVHMIVMEVWSFISQSESLR